MGGVWEKMVSKPKVLISNKTLDFCFIFLTYQSNFALLMLEIIQFIINGRNPSMINLASPSWWLDSPVLYLSMNEDAIVTNAFESLLVLLNLIWSNPSFISSSFSSSSVNTLCTFLQVIITSSSNKRNSFFVSKVLMMALLCSGSNLVRKHFRLLEIKNI